MNRDLAFSIRKAIYTEISTTYIEKATEVLIQKVLSLIVNNAQAH